MGTWTHIRTENTFGPYLSKTFQSLIHGPDIDGVGCELNQLGRLLNLDLTPFTILNYSGLWDESEFPKFDREALIKKQIEKDKIWNDLTAFIQLVDQLIKSINTGKIISSQLTHKFEWWIGYFNSPKENEISDSFYKDLRTIQIFLLAAKEKRESKVAFYVE